MQHNDRWGAYETHDMAAAALRNPPGYQATYERSSHGDSTQHSSRHAQPRSGYELYTPPHPASYNMDPAGLELPGYHPQASPRAGSSRPPYNPPAAYRPGGDGGQGYSSQTAPVPSYQPGAYDTQPHGSQASQVPAYQPEAGGRGAQGFDSQTGSAKSNQAGRYGMQGSQPARAPAYQPGGVQAYSSETAPAAVHLLERMPDREHQPYRSQAAPVLAASGDIGPYQPMRQARQEDPAHYVPPPLGSADYASQKPLYARPSEKSAYGRQQVLPPASYQPLASTGGGHPASAQRPASVLEGAWSNAEEEPPSRAAHPGGMGRPSAPTRQPTSPRPAYQPYQPYQPLKRDEPAEFRGHSEPHPYRAPSLANRRPPLEETAYSDPQQRALGRGIDRVTAGAWDPADSYDRPAHKLPPARAQPAPAQYDQYRGQQYASNDSRSPSQQMSGWDSPPPASARTRAPIPPRDDFGNQRSTGYMEEAADEGYRAPPPAKQGFSQSGGWLSPRQSGREEPTAVREAGHRPWTEQPVQQQAPDRQLSPRSTQTARFESGDVSAYDNRVVSRPPAADRTARPIESWDRPPPKSSIGADNWGEPPTDSQDRPPPKTGIATDNWGEPPTKSCDRPPPKTGIATDNWGERPTDSWDRPPPKTGIATDNWGEPPTKLWDRPPPKTGIATDNWGERPTASRDRPPPKTGIATDKWGGPPADSRDRPPPKTGIATDNWGEPPTASRDRPSPKTGIATDNWGEPPATETAHDAWGPTNQRQPAAHNSFNEEPSGGYGEYGSHGSDGHSDHHTDHSSFLQRLKREAAALKVPTRAQLMESARRAGAPEAPPSVSQNPDLERPSGSYAFGERGRFDDNRSHHSGPSDAVGPSRPPADRSFTPRSHSNKEPEDSSQWDAPVKHNDRGDNVSGWDRGENVSGWDTSPKSGSRNEKAAYGGAHLGDTMPKRAFTNDERHGGRGSGADNIDYRSRQAFDREEASHRGNPGRQQAAPGPEEDPRGFTRGPAPAETKTYGDWGAVEHKAAEEESGWGQAPDRAAADIDVGEWGKPAASGEQPRASREATREARTAPRAAEPFHEPPPPKPYQEPTKDAAVDEDAGGWGGGGGKAAQSVEEQMGWGEPPAKAVEEQVGWGEAPAVAVKEQMGWGEPAAEAAQEAWGADTGPRHSERQHTAGGGHDGEHNKGGSDPGSGNDYSSYAAFEPPAILTREERLAKIKAAMAKVGTIPTRKALLENANKKDEERRARREAKEAEAEARGEPIKRREVAPTAIEDNIQGWGDPHADASAAGNDGWGPADDGSGWGGDADDQPGAPAADQPQKENEAPHGAVAAPAANLAFQPVKEEDVKSDKRAPLDVDLNNIDIRLQAATGRAAAASPSQFASFLAPSSLVAAALTTEDESVSLSLKVHAVGAQPVDAAVLPPQQLPAAEAELRSVHFVVNEQDKDSPVLLVVSPSSGNSCTPAEPLDATQLHSRLQSLATQPGDAANGIAADLKGGDASAGAAHQESAPSGPSPEQKPPRALPVGSSKDLQAQPYSIPPEEALKEAPSEATKCEGQDNIRELPEQQPEACGSTEASVAGTIIPAKLQVFGDAVGLVIGTAGKSAEQAIAEDGTAEHPASVFSAAGPPAPPLTIATTEWAAGEGVSADAEADGCPGPAVEDREAADSRRAKLSSLEETKDVDPSVSPRKVQMQRVHRMPSWETPAETAPANQQQAENEPLLVLTKVTSEEAGESQDDTASSGTPSTSTIVEPPTSERSLAGSLGSFAGSDAPAMRLMKTQKDVTLHPVQASMLVEEKGGEATAATVDPNPAVSAVAGLPAADKLKSPAAEPAAIHSAAPKSSDTEQPVNSAKQANAIAKKEVAAEDISSEPSLVAAFAQDAPAEHLNSANAEGLPARVENKKTAANAPAESAADPKATPAGETDGVPARAHLLRDAVQQGHVQSQQDTAQAAPSSPVAAANLDFEDQAAHKPRTTKEPGVHSTDVPIVLVTSEDSKSEPSVDVPGSAQQQTEGGSRKLAEGCKITDADGDSEAIKTDPAAAKAAISHGAATLEVEGSDTFDEMLGSKQKPAVEPPHSAADPTIQQAALPLIMGAVPASAHTASASTNKESAFSEAASKGADAVPAEADVATAEAPTQAHLHSAAATSQAAGHGSSGVEPAE